MLKCKRKKHFSHETSYKTNIRALIQGLYSFFKDSNTFQGIYTTLKALFHHICIVPINANAKKKQKTDLWITWVMYMDELW